MIINRASLDALFTNFRADYEAGALAAASLKDRIAMTVPSATREETYGWLGNNNRLREWAGDRVIKNLTAEGFTITNRNFENTVAVSRNDIEDDRVGVYSGAMKMMGQDAALHPDELIFELLRSGTTQKCYDGQYFFDTDHPRDPDNASAGTVSNADMTNATGAPGWVLLDTSKVIKPFIFQRRKDYSFVAKDQDSDENVFMRNEYVYGVDARVNAGYGLWQLAYASDKTLDATSYATARAAMMALKAPTGKPLGIKPDLMLVAPSFEGAALQLLNLDTSHYKGTVELIVCPWMA